MKLKSRKPSLPFINTPTILAETTKDSQLQHQTQLKQIISVEKSKKEEEIELGNLQENLIYDYSDLQTLTLSVIDLR